jgi:hypothetical protein
MTYGSLQNMYSGLSLQDMLAFAYVVSTLWNMIISKGKQVSALHPSVDIVVFMLTC